MLRNIFDSIAGYMYWSDGTGDAVVIDAVGYVRICDASYIRVFGLFAYARLGSNIKIFGIQL